MIGNSATRGGNYRKTERRLRVLIIFQRTVQMFTTHLLQIYEKESAFLWWTAFFSIFSIILMIQAHQLTSVMKEKFVEQMDVLVLG